MSIFIIAEIGINHNGSLEIAQPRVAHRGGLASLTAEGG